MSLAGRAASAAKRKRCFVAVSGGVDSSFCAWLAKEGGEDFEAIYMRNWVDDAPSCTHDEDVAVLRQVCQRLGVRLRMMDLSEEYWRRVFADYLHQLQTGLTPNPDVYCNQQIKFGALLEAAKAQGCERLVTGHYARIGRVGDELQLRRAKDRDKDQSYFLYLLDQEMLAQASFPLGDWLKADVRQAARRAGLANHDRPDSTGICFIGERDWRGFIREHIKVNEGEIRSLDDGRPLGSHLGACLYTIGQRQGLGIGGQADGSGKPWYVAAKDIGANIVYVVEGSEHPALHRSELTVGQLHWIGGAPDCARSYSCKLRYRQEDIPCRIAWLEGRRCGVRLDQPAFAIAPGQAFVLYDGERCLGGGAIEREGGAAGPAAGGGQAL